MELLDRVIELTKKFFEEKFEPVLSEGQLQFNLANHYSLVRDLSKVYVECPIITSTGSRRSADIVIVHNDSFIVVELKYKTAEWPKVNKGELNLVKQSGQTQSVSAFYEDIKKIREQPQSGLEFILTSNPQFQGGLAVFCSNDKYYFEESERVTEGTNRSKLIYGGWGSTKVEDFNFWIAKCHNKKYDFVKLKKLQKSIIR